MYTVGELCRLVNRISFRGDTNNILWHLVTMQSEFVAHWTTFTADVGRPNRPFRKTKLIFDEFALILNRLSFGYKPICHLCICGSVSLISTATCNTSQISGDALTPPSVIAVFTYAYQPMNDNPAMDSIYTSIRNNLILCTALLSF